MELLLWLIAVVLVIFGIVTLVRGSVLAEYSSSLWDSWSVLVA
jgi:hypothetical protein